MSEQHVITVMPGANPSMDDASDLADELVREGWLQEWRPAMAMGDGIELIPVAGVEREEIVREFEMLNYEVVD